MSVDPAQSTAQSDLTEDAIYRLQFAIGNDAELEAFDHPVKVAREHASQAARIEQLQARVRELEEALRVAVCGNDLFDALDFATADLYRAGLIREESDPMGERWSTPTAEGVAAVKSALENPRPKEES